MSNTDDSTASEPVISRTLYVLAGTVVANLVVALGVPVSADTKTLIIGVISLLAPALLGALARGAVFSPATVEAIRKAFLVRIADAEADHNNSSTAPLGFGEIGKHERE